MINQSAMQKRSQSGVARVIAECLPLFSLNLCGLIAVRIWIQCNLYDRYVSTDSGIITIVSNLVRVALIVIVIAVVARRGFSANAQRWAGYASIASMTLASLLFLVNTEVGSPTVLWAACIFAGCGIVWGGGMWICLYVRLPSGEALFYAFFSLGISSLFGFFLGLMPENITYLIAILMPSLALIMYQRSQRVLDEREASELARGRRFPRILSEEPGGSTGGEVVSASVLHGVSDGGKDSVYDGEPKSTFIRLIIGIALFNLALGIARGFPLGESIALPVFFQAIHQFMVLLLSLGLIWWALGKRRTIKFSTLWNISMILIASGVLVLAAAEETLDPLGATLIAISNTFAVGLLWFSCYDMARHSSIPAYIILGFGWAAHILPREIGRAGIWLIEPHSMTATIITAVIIVLLALSMAFLLNDSIPLKRHLFAEFRGKKKRELFRDRVVAHVADSMERVPEQSVLLPESLPIAEPPATSEPATTLAPSAVSKPTSSEKQELPTMQEPPSTREKQEQSNNYLETGLMLLGKRYYLTERELEVVGLLAQGRSRIAIGQKLYISENTVRTYVKNIYAKLDIHSKQELIDYLEQQSE